MIKILLASLALLLPSDHPLAEAPPQATGCAVCHGAAGVSGNPEWPNLAGQKKGYLVEQITAFRDGRRDNPLMAPMLAGLSDGDIETLASYYASRPAGVSRNGDMKLVEQGQNRAAYCLACHGMQGVTANPEWPNLAGQQARYLQNQLAAFKSGERSSNIMQHIVARFSEQDFAAMAAYYSQLKP